MRKQAQMTMRCMQALVRVQARVRARRFQLTHQDQLGEAEEEEEYEEQMRRPMSPMKRTHLNNRWDNSRHSSHKIQENYARKQDALMKRERALSNSLNYQVTQFPFLFFGDIHSFLFHTCKTT